MKIRASRFGALVLPILLVTAAVILISSVGDQPRRVTFTSHGWAFDKNDLRSVAGYADAVALMSVVSIDGSAGGQSSPPVTTYSVEVRALFKGQTEALVQVSQLGVGRLGEEVQWLDGVRPIEEDRDYVVAIKSDPDQRLWIVSAPRSPDLVTASSQREIIVDWQRAIEDQQVPR